MNNDDSTMIYANTASTLGWDSLTTLNTNSYITKSYTDLEMCESISDSYLQFLTEEEIVAIFNNLKSRDLSSGQTNVKQFVKAVLRVCHLSEKTILEMYEYTSKYDIMRCHAHDVNSGKYPTIKLLFEAKE